MFLKSLLLFISLLLLMTVYKMNYTHNPLFFFTVKNIVSYISNNDIIDSNLCNLNNKYYRCSNALKTFEHYYNFKSEEYIMFSMKNVKQFSIFIDRKWREEIYDYDENNENNENSEKSENSEKIISTHDNMLIVYDLYMGVEYYINYDYIKSTNSTIRCSFAVTNQGSIYELRDYSFNCFIEHIHNIEKQRKIENVLIKLINTNIGLTICNDNDIITIEKQSRKV